jgi:beta-glucosidase
MAATWNPELVERLGAAIGAEARFHDVVLLLGPGLNQKRHPLGGRNFEYYSEDPFLTGTMAAAFVRGVQSQGVGATLKHYAVNNQEYRRMLIDAVVDDRTLREIYLRGFEIAVKNGRPQAVMSSYNSVNGTFVSQNRLLLTDILRNEWGFDGMVVSDWTAVDDAAAAVAAGLDLEMPANPLTPPMIVEAVQDGSLDEAALDRAVAGVLQLVERHRSMVKLPKEDVSAANHELARNVAAESMVLLANDGILPITDGTARRIGVIGTLAHSPRIQGIGSSQVNPSSVDDPWTHLAEIGSADGHTLEAWNDDYAEDGLTGGQSSDLEGFLERQELILVFAGQKASHDAEAWDRPSMELAPADLELVEASARSGRPFAVILTGGASMNVGPFKDHANAILMGWLGGQAVGGAVADVVFGRRSPSGRLSETFALSVADHPSAINFPGGPRTVRYGEGLYVGYRYFQSFDREVAYPFGHGLSYTTFEYVDAAAPPVVDTLDETFRVTVRLANTGSRPGAETVQIYLRHLDPQLDRPDRELVGFRKVELAAGEARDVVIPIHPERLAYYHDDHDRWVIESGAYELLVGASAADIRHTVPVEVTVGTLPRRPFTLSDTLGDIAEDPRGKVVIDWFLTLRGFERLDKLDPFIAAIIRDMPFRKCANTSEGAVSQADLEKVLALINSDMTPEQVTENLEKWASQ